MEYRYGLFAALIFFSILLLPDASALSAEYQGAVGDSEAIFHLDWSGERVWGSYHYTGNPGLIRRLEGRNPSEGLIELDEYVGQSLVAKSRLTKTLTKNEIIWSGTRNDQDGVKSIRFSRLRGGGPSAPQMPAPAAETGILADVPHPAENALSSAEAASRLGIPGQLEAHLYGRLYLGWFVPGPVGHDGDLTALISKMRELGQPTWAAMRFHEKSVELQFETPSGERHRLLGKQTDEGTIAVRDEDGTAWRFDKTALGNTVLWGGRTEGEPTRTLLIYAPNPESNAARDLVRLAPEAFLYVYHVGGEDFYRARFPHLQADSIEATVISLEHGPGGVDGIVLRSGDGQDYAIRFPSPRLRSRIPVAEGYPVTLSLRDGTPAHLGIHLTPVSWRNSGQGRLELQMVSTDQAQLEYDDRLNATFPPGRFESLDKIVVDPDYALLATEVYAQWHLAEDKIAWTVGDEGAAMLELEGLDLDLPTANRQAGTSPGPWQPLSRPVDFPTNQLRMLNLNDTMGYLNVLPPQP